MDHFEKMATAEYLEGRMKELDQFHDGLSTGDAEATKMRELRRREGVKVSPSSEPERRRKERDDDQGRHEGKRRKVDEGRDKGSSRKQDDQRTQGEGRRRSRSRSTKRRGDEGPTTSRRRASDSKRGESVKKEDEKEATDLRWKPGSGKYGMLRESQKKEQKLDQQDFVGGMKNPAEVVEGLPTLQNLGRRILGAWERLCGQCPQITKVGETYGSPDCVMEKKWVDRWKGELRKLTGAKGASTVKLKGKWSYQSPLDGNLFEAWGRRAHDPETEVAKWIKDGAPLGINSNIRRCNIFPPADDKHHQRELGDVDTAQSLREDIGNYVSVVEQREDAEAEIERLKGLGYAIAVRKEEVEAAGFEGVTISKLGLIVKTKEDGSKKRRIIIDLRRSGGNSKALLPERLVLPRPMDAVLMLKKLHLLHAEEKEAHRRTMELVMVDISDAYMHLAIKESEKGHCLAPALDDDRWLLFVALLFGYKTAPLTWSRVAAMVARLVQSIIPAEKGMRQVYLDDSLWALCGTLNERNRILSCILTTMAALGLKLSLSKGERGAAVPWVGIRFKLVAPGGGRDTGHSSGPQTLGATTGGGERRGHGPIRFRDSTGFDAEILQQRTCPEFLGGGTGRDM